MHRLLCAADEAVVGEEKQRREHDPGELVPVEEGEAEDGGLGARVERREAKAKVRRDQQQRDPA